jgi:hypothetical protein
VSHHSPQIGQLVANLRGPRSLLRALLLVALIVVWLYVGMAVFGTPIVDHATQYDLVWPYYAGHMLLGGGDPYSSALSVQIINDPSHSAYPYPLASFWLVLPLLALPLPLAATLWVSASICALVALGPLLDSSLPPWALLAPLLFYPSLYALLITQWAPLQMLLLAASLWLFRRGQPLWAGFLLPLVAVKPPTGIALLLFAAVLCARDRRWWLGALLGGVLWYGAPLLLMPDWPLRWLATMRQYANPSDQQHLLTLAYLPDGALCGLAALAIGAWQLWRRNALGAACALLILAMLLTPHRAQYDYPLFALPLLLLPRRHVWLAAAAVAASWLLPLTFELGWASSLQLSLFTVAPAIVASALVERFGASTLGEA